MGEIRWQEGEEMTNYCSSSSLSVFVLQCKSAL